ncbi:hypothetical protein AB0284_06345 [Pseudarthrobacter phenanthrenivorans]|uniref:hypothetical protein n=1 Tax=Pseudarthrobacter phenanthrenivorans TaxID=361575 RepID=UPI00344EB667
MDLRLLLQVLSLRAAGRRREQWDPVRIAAYQEQALKRLREAAYAGSAFVLPAAPRRAAQRTPG